MGLFLLLKGLDDHPHHCINVLHDFIVPESQYFISMGIEEPCPFVIIFFLFQVLASIHFDHQLWMHYAKIDDIRSDGMLLPEVYSIRVVGS